MICSRQVSLLSVIMPRYFGVELAGIMQPSRNTGGQPPVLNVNVVWVDFSAFTTTIFTMFTTMFAVARNAAQWGN